LLILWTLDLDRPVLEFSDQHLKHRKGHTASSVAEILRRNGVQWAVLCACRTAKITSTFSHLALEFLNHGVTGVFAMRYELKAAAAKILTSSFYLALCRDGKSFIEAGYASRRAMKDNASRPARFGERIEIQDFLVPAIYSRDGADFCLADHRPADSISAVSLRIPLGLPELIGREDDIRQLSALLKGESSFVILSADIGNGKSLLMRHLAWWWKETHLFARTTYVNVSMAESGHDINNSVGLLAVAKGIWRSVRGDGVACPEYSDPKRYLFEAMEAAKGHEIVVLLDGIDETYLPSSESEDTSADWADFFRVARILSITGFRLLVATCTPLLLVLSEAEDVLFELGVSMTNEEAWQLACSGSDDGTLPPPGLSKESPDTHLRSTLEVLQYNRVVLKSQSNLLQGRFHGLDTVLSWDIPFEEDTTDVSFLEALVSKTTAILSLDLSDNKGLDRTHHVMIAILKHLAQLNRYPDMCALISIGLWVDVLPNPEGIVNIFDTEDISLKIPLLQHILNSVPESQADKAHVPFELWSSMRVTPATEKRTYFSSKEEVAESFRYAVRLLVAAKLITGRSEILIDGRQGYRLHPALTIWLRRILSVLQRNVICFNFIGCMEERASQMGGLNPNANDFRSGNAKLLRAVESPSFDFVEREKWNLMAAIVGLTQKVHYFSSIGVELPSDGPRFAWASFIALSPISASREDFCAWFLTHVTLKSLKDIAPLMPESYREPLPNTLTHFLFLVLLNWIIWMSQRYRLDQDLVMPLRLRRLVLDRVQDIRDAGINCEELLEPDFAMAEAQAWLTESWIAMRPGEVEDKQPALNQYREKIIFSTKDLERGWDPRMDVIDHLMNEQSLSKVNSPQDLRLPRNETTGFATPLPDRAAMASFAMDRFRQSVIAPGKNSDDPTINGWIMDILSFMETDIDFMLNLRPWYMHKLISIFTHLRKGNIPRAITAALSGLNVAERDGDILLASNFRQLGRRLADLDTIDEYDVQQTRLARTAEQSAPLLRDFLVIYMANHDTPGAYQHIENERIKLKAMVLEFSTFRTIMKSISSMITAPDQKSIWENMPESNAFAQTGLEGLDQLLGLLEPYKNAKLEDKTEWVHLIRQIWDLMDELTDQNTPEDRAWIHDLYKTYPEPKKARAFWSNQGVSKDDAPGDEHLHME
jgi:hypothetical protein